MKRRLGPPRLASSALATLLLTLAAQPAIASEAETAYRYLHANPERGKDLPKAHAYIRGRLEALGQFSFEEVPALPSAVLAVLDSGRPGPVIALRADMDAREGNEPASHNPRSSIPGIMHNCGHDAHSAMLLGAATALSVQRSSFTGKIVFVFQPAEEVKGGADDIVADGILGRLGVRAIFAQHVVGGLPVGRVTLSQGSAIAGNNRFKLTLSGAKSHAAMPHQGSDLGVATAKIVVELANLPAHGWDISNRPAIISVTKLVSSPDTVSETPSEVVIEGTLRAFEPLGDPTAPTSLNHLIAARIAGLAQVYGVTANWSVTPGTPPTVNDSKLAALLPPELGTAQGIAIDVLPDRYMTSEDFAFFSQNLRALYFGQGIAKGGLGMANVHQDDFTIHPDALENGVRLMVALAKIATQKLQ